MASRCEAQTLYPFVDDLHVVILHPRRNIGSVNNTLHPSASSPPSQSLEATMPPSQKEVLPSPFTRGAVTGIAKQMHH